MLQSTLEYINLSPCALMLHSYFSNMSQPFSAFGRMKIKLFSSRRIFFNKTETIKHNRFKMIYFHDCCAEMFWCNHFQRPQVLNQPTTFTMRYTNKMAHSIGPVLFGLLATNRPCVSRYARPGLETTRFSFNAVLRAYLIVLGQPFQ